jgi:hypothetical protein
LIFYPLHELKEGYSALGTRDHALIMGQGVGVITPVLTFDHLVAIRLAHRQQLSTHVLSLPMGQAR